MDKYEDNRTAAEFEGHLKQLIMQETWLRSMVEERIKTLHTWRRGLEADLKKSHPFHDTSVPLLSKGRTCATEAGKR